MHHNPKIGESSEAKSDANTSSTAGPKVNAIDLALSLAAVLSAILVLAFSTAAVNTSRAATSEIPEMFIFVTILLMLFSTRPT